MPTPTWRFELKCPHCSRVYQLNVIFVTLGCTCKKMFTMDQAVMTGGTDLHLLVAPTTAPIKKTA